MSSYMCLLFGCYDSYYNPYHNVGAGMLGFALGMGLGSAVTNRNSGCNCSRNNSSIFAPSFGYNWGSDLMMNSLQLEYNLASMINNSFANFYTQYAAFGNLTGQGGYRTNSSINANVYTTNSYSVDSYNQTPNRTDSVPNRKLQKPCRQPKTEGLSKNTPNNVNKKNVQSLQISDNGKQFIKGLEGFREYAYYDGNPSKPAEHGDPANGTLTIGYGHTQGVYIGQYMTREEADELFDKDIVKYEKYVKQYVTVSLTQNQYDALVSFCYNIGPGNFVKSELLKELNKGNYQTAANLFSKYNKANGSVNPGLVNRRKKETDIFLT